MIQRLKMEDYAETADVVRALVRSEIGAMQQACDNSQLYESADKV
jgi:hypothetical protein